MAQSPERVRALELLGERWKDMSPHGAGPEEQAIARGMVEAVKGLELINDLEAEAWLRRFAAVCPGHQGGGQQWCAYCGDLPTCKGPGCSAVLEDAIVSGRCRECGTPAPEARA